MHGKSQQFTIRMVLYWFAVIAAILVGGPSALAATFIILTVGSAAKRCWHRKILFICLVLGVLLVIAALTLPRVNSPRGMRPSSHRYKQARTLAVAIQANQTRTGKVLPPVVRDEQTGTDVSWRVVLLPDLDEARLFARYDFSKPWDSSTNKSLIEYADNPYRDIAELSKDAGISHFEMIARRHEDGTLTPLLLVETACPEPWTKPSFLTPEEFLADYTRPESRVPWDVGIHNRRIFTDYGWNLSRIGLIRLFRTFDESMSVNAAACQTQSGTK